MKKQLFILSLLAFFAAGFLLLGAEGVQAATYTWDTDGVDNNWSTTTNWSPTGSPGASDDVVFSGSSVFDCNIDTVVSINSLSLQSGFTGNVIQEENVTIGSGNYSQTDGFFTGSGVHEIYLNGSFTLASGDFLSPGTFLVSGDWTHTAGGEFLPNGGEVIADGTGVATSYDFNSGLTGSGGFYRYRVDMASGDVTIASGDALVIDNRLRLQDGELNGDTTIMLLGDLSLKSGWNGGNAEIEFSGSSTAAIDAVGAEAVYNNDITINKDSGFAVKLNSDLDLDGSDQDIVVQGGVFNFNGNNLTVDDVAGSIEVQSGATLKLNGTETATLSNAIDFQSGSNALYSSSTADVNIKDWAYQNLIINGGSSYVFSLGATESIAGDLTVTAGKFNLNGYDLTVSGIVSNEDFIQLQGGETVSLTNDTDSGTVEFLGDGDSLLDTFTITDFSPNFFNLTITSTDGTDDTFNLGEALDINANFTTNNGTFDVTANNYQVTLGGSWGHNGGGGVVLNMREGTFLLNSDASSTISGGPSFYNLTSITAGKTINFFESQTVTVSGDLVLTGADGNEITLASTSPGTQWGITVVGTPTVSYVNVTDSDASGGVAITANNSTSGGNNNLWTFPGSGSGGSANVIISETYSITLLTPNGEETVPLDGTYAITWESTDNIDTVNIYYSSNGGSNYSLLVSGEGNDGEFTWEVDESAVTSGLIKIDALSSGTIKDSDTSDSSFSIAVVDEQEEEDEEETVDDADEGIAADTQDDEEDEGAQTGINPFTGEVEEVSAVETGMYIRSESYATVYYVEGQTRRPFMNEKAFFTYQESFDNIIEVTDATLPTLSMGEPMLPKAGVTLVKVQTDPKVYWVEDGAVLHWVTSEELAIELFGSDWADYVIDVEATFMARFETGDDFEGASDFAVDQDVMRKREDLHE